MGMQTAEQITETALSPDEAAYAEVSAKLTLADLAYQDALEARNRYRYNHPLPTLEVQARLIELEDEITQRACELQALLEPYSRLKDKVNGW